MRNHTSRAARMQWSQQSGSASRTYATRPHPSDSIPVKNALPISSRNLRRLQLTLGGVAVGALINYAWSSGDQRGGLAEKAWEKPWSTFVLESKDVVSPTSAIFNLRTKDKASLTASSYDTLFRNAIWAVDIQQPQIQIVREYTPLPPPVDADGKTVPDGEGATLHLLIREEFKGEVSGYLHRLPIGADVEISKPYAQVDLSKENPGNMVFVVGGTGITTALQAIHALLETKTGKQKEQQPNIHILWANRRREDCLGGISDSADLTGAADGWWRTITSWVTGGGSGRSAGQAATELGKSPLIDELRRLKGMYEGKIKVDYYVDEEGTTIKAEHIGKALAAASESNLSEDQSDKSASTQSKQSYVAISGPDGFMVNLAGEKRVLKNRIVDRPMSGMLAEVKDRDWKLMVLG